MAFLLTNSQSHVIPHTHPTSDINGLTELIQANAVVVSATAPENPTSGKLWYNTTKGVFNIYNGSSWILVGPEVTPITKAQYDALSNDDKNDGRFYLITDNDGTIIVDWANVENKPTIPTSLLELSGTSDDITEGSSHLFMTPAERTNLGNQSGVNTGDQSASDFDIKDLADTTNLRSTWSGKQDVISDLATIRSGASAGATAVQPNDNVSTLTNDAGYITNAVNDLANYYTKTQTYTKTEVDQMISEFGGFEVVETLPTENIKTNVIYLKGPIGTGGDKYEEWIYSNSQWVLIGETSVDLSNYFNTFTDTSDRITEGSTNLFVTSSEKTTWNAKQDALVSGTNIKTVNGNSLLGSGDVVIPLGKNDIVRSTLPPQDTTVLWYDTANFVLNYYNDDAWKPLGVVNGGSVEPDYNITGNLWYDINNNVLRVYRVGTGWKDLAYGTSSSTAPTTVSAGHIWYDTADNVLKVYDGTNWIVTGKTYTAGDGINIDANNGISVDVTDIIGTGLSEDANNNIIVDTTVIQEKLIAGTNVTITNNTISATDTTYTAGTGIDISNDEISIDTTVVATKTDLSSKQDTISDLATIRSGASAGATAIQPNDNVSELTNDAGYITSSALDDYSTTTEMNNAISTATSGLATESYVDTALSSKQDTLTAGTGINIDANNEISNTLPGPTIAATAPTGTEGALWYDTTNDILMAHDGTDWKEAGTQMKVLSYGNSTWQDFIDAYNKNAIVYCRASSNQNPATGTQGRMAFMAYVNSADNPTEVEFQYYRSRSNHDSAANQVDEVYVYKLVPTNGGTWTVTQRNTGAKLVAGSNVSITWGSGNAVINATDTTYTASDGIDIDGSNNISVDVTDIIGTGLSEDSNNNIIVDSTVVALKSDLTNYYTKTDTYTKTEVDNLVASVGSFEVVSTLPSADTADTKKIYLLGPIGTGADKYEEYIVTESEGVKSWTKIGETSIDLSGYATTTALTNGLATKQDTLVSGTNIKTINNESLLGSGNITISAPTYTAGEGIDITNDEISVDTDVIQEKLTAGTGISITGGTVCTTESDRKGPAPSGFHVPSRLEWGDILSGLQFLGLSGCENAMTYLKLPMAGYREYDTTYLDNRGTIGCYWTSTPNDSTTAYILSFDGSNISVENSISRSAGLPIRAFKNTIALPDSTWTVLSGTLGSGGVFWNQAEGLITVTGDGTMGYTIMDKNLGATQVWNYGDAEGQEETCGQTYQWGNNYGFTGDDNLVILDPSHTKRDVTGYGPTNYYSNSYWVAESPWQDSTSNGNDLWGNVSNGTHQECETTPLTISSTVNGFNPSNTGTEGQVLTKTSTGYNWADAQGGVTVGTTAPSNPSAGDLWYDTTSTVLALKVYNGSAWQMVGPEVVPITQAAYDALSTAEKNNGKFYLITNASGTISVDWANITNKPSLQSKTTVGNAAPSTTPTEVGTFYLDSTNDKLYVAVGTTASTDWLEVGSNSGGGNVIAMTQAEYNALTTEEKNDGKLRIITDAPTEDISVDWSNVANKSVDISTQTGTLSSVKIWVGSQTDYEALATKDPNTLYFTTNVVSGS